MNTNLSIATLSAELAAAAPDEFRLLPAGVFRAADGRPEGISGWRLDPEDMARLVADAESRATDYPIDYEHQIIEAKQNGKPAPAAGWFRRLEAREDGLYAVEVRWTKRARKMIKAGEYRYISPVFSYDKKTGHVTRLLMAAITNNPALDGLTDLSPLTHTMEEFAMSASIAALAAHLDTKDGEDAAVAALAALKAKDAEIAALKAEVEAIQSAAVPLGEHAKLQAEIAALTQRIEADERARLLEAGLADGRILPAQKDYWAVQPLASLKAWLDVAQPLAALVNTQSARVAANAGTAALTDEQALLVKIGGWPPEVFKQSQDKE